VTDRRLLAVGLAGSLLVAVGGLGAGAMPSTYAGPLHGAVVASTVLSMCGVVLLLVAWWFLRRARSTGLVLRAFGLWALPLLVGPPLFSRDVYAYAGQARLVALGLDPYTAGPSSVPGPLAAEVDGVWGGTPSPYGPVFLWLAGQLERATGEHVFATVLALRLLAVAGLALVAWGLPRLAAAHGVPPVRALWLGLANPLVLLHLVAGAHNDALMIGLLVAGIAVAMTTRMPGRLVAAGALVTLAALVKAPAAAGLAFLPLTVIGVTERARAALTVALTAAVTAVLVTAATGLGWGWVHTLDAGNARLSLFSPTTGLGLAVGELADGGLHVVQFLGVLAGLAVSAVLLLRADRVGPVRALGLALLAVVVLGPTVQAWYLLWGLVLLAAVIGKRTATAFAATCVVLCLLVLPSGRHLVRPPLYGVPALLAAAAAVLVVRRTAERAPA
jgi:alpha-1,6-mannosyltransferase